VLGFLKQSLQPASIAAFLLLLFIGLALIYSRRTAIARFGRWWLTALFFGYWLISCPAGVRLLARTLTADYRPLASADEARGAQAVVLLSAGSRNIRAAGGRLPMVTYPTALRALEAARVYRLLGNPIVVCSGGRTDPEPDALPESEAMRLAMIQLGVPPDRIIGESESSNTHDEAVALKRIFKERVIERFVIVTSSVHMGRSLATFASEGLYPVGSAAPLYPDAGNRSKMFPLMPSDASLDVGNAIIYEWLALAYYWKHGWLGEPKPGASHPPSE
jgi:uncharacterized SAM-binding protein YcdF (DUF218 family)